MIHSFFGSQSAQITEPIYRLSLSDFLWLLLSTFNFSDFLAPLYFWFFFPPFLFLFPSLSFSLLSLAFLARNPVPKIYTICSPCKVFCWIIYKNDSILVGIGLKEKLQFCLLSINCLQAKK